MYTNDVLATKKPSKKIILIVAIVLLMVAAIISTVIIVRNAEASKNSASPNAQNKNSVSGIASNKSQGEKDKESSTSTSAEVVTNADGSIVTTKPGTITAKSPEDNSGVKSSSIISNGTTSKASTKATTKAAAKTTATTTTKATVTTLAQNNSTRIANLKSRTGVSVLIGSAANTWYDGSERPGETDPQVIATWLDVIEKQVNRYPSGFFKEINPSHIVKVALIHYVNGDLAGFASYEFGDDLSIGLDTTLYDSLTSKRAFNHEVMHIIEKHIEFEAYPQDDPFSGTWSFIPQYAINSSGNYYTIFDPDRRPAENWQEMYFVSAYAKTNAREDRAETFADYMFRGYQQNYMKNSSYPMPKKMAIINSLIRQYFSSARSAPAGSLPWETYM